MTTKMLRLHPKVSYSKRQYTYRHRKNARAIPLGARAIEAEAVLRQIDPDYFRYMLHWEGPLRRCKQVLYSGMFIRAGRSNRACMSRDELEELWRRSGGRCELTGIEFNVDPHGNCVKRPWAPSIDRKDNAKGYEFENCRLVCTAVNLALNEFGDEVLMRIARALVR